MRITHTAWHLTTRWLALAALGAVLLLGLACGGSSDKNAATLKDPNQTGRDLVTKYMTLLQQKDANGLKSFVSDAFIVQRADGSTSDKTAYLQSFPDVGQFTLTNVTALQNKNVLVVRWDVSVHETVDGKPYDTTPAPRLSTFYYDGGNWQLTSHANFNAPEGGAACEPDVELTRRDGAWRLSVRLPPCSSTTT